MPARAYAAEDRKSGGLTWIFWPRLQQAADLTFPDFTLVL